MRQVAPDWSDRVGGGTPGRHPALRALGWFWLAALVLMGAGAGGLEYLGPPAPRSLAAPKPPAAPTPAPLAAPPAPASAAPPPVPALPAKPVHFEGAPASPAPQSGGPIAAPDPALLEASATYPGTMLPRISADRRSPMSVYAAAAPPADGRPRVALMLTGVGMLASEDEVAVRSTPAAVSLAFSPYAYHPEPLLQQARTLGHEALVSLPMEPAGYPLNNPGAHALLTGDAPALNLQQLDWSLTRFTGYVGVTGAMGNLRGEGFGGNPTLMQPVLAELAQRGLLYIDARPGAPHPAMAVGRAVDLVIDEPAVRTEIDAKLAQLEVLARAHGSAIGLAGPPRPVTVARINAWANGLAARGFVLVPVSAAATMVPPARSGPAAVAAP